MNCNAKFYFSVNVFIVAVVFPPTNFKKPIILPEIDFLKFIDEIQQLIRKCS